MKGKRESEVAFSLLPVEILSRWSTVLFCALRGVVGWEIISWEKTGNWRRGAWGGLPLEDRDWELGLSVSLV